jgi:hypothetical protein
MVVMAYHNLIKIYHIVWITGTKSEICNNLLLGTINRGFGDHAGAFTPDGKLRWGVTGLPYRYGFCSTIALDSQGNS